MRHHADDDKGAVCKQGDQRQEHAGGDGHKQVIGREATELANSFEQVPAIRKEHLIKAFSPTHALFPRSGKRQRLLIIEFSGGIADANAVHGAERRELDILSKCMEVPAVHSLDNLGRNKVPGTGYRA